MFKDRIKPFVQPTASPDALLVDSNPLVSQEEVPGASLEDTIAHVQEIDTAYDLRLQQILAPPSVRRKTVRRKQTRS
jgi:hypothetical protein